MKCNQCGKEINNTAKFCRFCGQMVANKVASPNVEKDTEKKCQNCAKMVSSIAKFCRFCGNALNEVDDFSGNQKGVQDNTFFDVERNYVTWNILHGQLAVKIDEKDIIGYGNIKGLYIAPGTKAMFFVNGKHATTLESGKYQFKDFIHDERVAEAFKPERKQNSLMNFLRNVAGFISNGIETLFRRRTNIRDFEGEKVFYSVVLIRDVKFNLPFTFQDITTANIRSEIGLDLRCEISDVDSFFENNLVDQKYVGLESFATSLSPIIKIVLNQVLASYSPQQVPNNPEIYQKVFDALRERISRNYSYFAIEEIVSLSALQEDLEKIRRLREDLYIAEQELEQAQLREDFLNKMQNMEHSNLLRSARSEVDFNALMDKIDEDRLLNEDQKAQFVMMLSSERLLREARNSVEVQNALDGLTRSRLLSTEEVEILKRNIAQRGAMAELTDAHAIAMATLKNNIEIDSETLTWELDIGNKRFENQLNRQRAQDDYADYRRNSDLNFENKVEDSKIDRLSRLQEIEESKKQAEHLREMEHKKLESDTELEHHRITSTMTFEQIMASNPDVSPEAAAAFAEKYKAMAASAQNADKDELYHMMLQMQKDSNTQLATIIGQQMNLMQDTVNAQIHNNNTALNEKQKELDRIHEDSERHQDRMLSGMETTVNAVSKSRIVGNTPTANNVGGTFCYCPNCGKKQNPQNKTCTDCGAEIE